MKPNRTIHNIVLGIGLAVLGGSLWWVAKQMTPAVAGAQSHGSRIGQTVLEPPASPVDSLSHRRPLITGSGSKDISQRRALLTDAVTRQQTLAVAQGEALAGLSESELSDALASFAASHRVAIEEADEAQDRWLKPAGMLVSPAPLAGADAAGARFAAVRRALIDEGLSLDEAEARFVQAATEP